MRTWCDSLRVGKKVRRRNDFGGWEGMGNVGDGNSGRELESGCKAQKAEPHQPLDCSNPALTEARTERTGGASCFCEGPEAVWQPAVDGASNCLSTGRQADGRITIRYGGASSR